MATREQAKSAVRTLLEYIGDNPSRSGLRETPGRVVDSLREMTSAPDYDLTTFKGGEYDQMIVQRGIPVYSLCEHHLLPIVGHADVGYIPNGGEVVGLSKLARCVEHHARRLQNQERITEGVADELMDELDPLGVGVVIQARHFCMEMRGVKKHNTSTTTSSMLGVFRDDAEARNELLSLDG